MGEEYDLWSGLSLEALKARETARQYTLPYYDRKTIAEIEQCLNQGSYTSRDIVLEHLTCLDAIAKKLAMVSVLEHQNHVVDSTLDAERQHLRDLIVKMEQLLTRLPRAKIYRSMQKRLNTTYSS